MYGNKTGKQREAETKKQTKKEKTGRTTKEALAQPGKTGFSMSLIDPKQFLPPPDCATSHFLSTDI